MALWQATFQLVATRGFPANYRELLDEIAPRIRSWSRDVEWWGSEDGDRIDVLLQGGWPIDGLLRVDLRALDLQFIRDVLRLAVDLGFRLVGDDGQEIEPAPDAFMRALRSSRALRFVEHPFRDIQRLISGGFDER